MKKQNDQEEDLFNRRELEEQLLMDYMEDDDKKSKTKPAKAAPKKRASEEDDTEAARSALRAYLGKESDEDDEENEANDERESKKLFLPLTLAIGALILIFIGYLWNTGSIVFSIREQQSDKVALIKAETTPARVAATGSESEGETVPDTDKNVYDAFNPKAQKATPKVEHIRPGPEEPVNLKVLDQKAAPKEEAATETPVAEKTDPEAVKTEAPQATAAPSTLSELIEKTEDQAKAATETPVAEEKPAVTEEVKTETAGPDEVSSETPAPEEKVAAAPKITEVKTNETTASKESRKPKLEAEKKKGSKSAAFRIQLGAFKSKEEALGEWKKIQAAHAALLSDMDPVTDRADLGAKGIYYRLQAGAFKNEQDARKICQKLVDKKQGCFSVKGQ